MSWDKKPRFCKIHQDLASFANSVIACTYVGFDAAMCLGYNPYPHFREALYAATGLEIGVPEMLLLREPLPRGNSAHQAIPEDVLQGAIDEYYKLRGWDDYGPTDEKLAQLDMRDFIGLIERGG
jgi:aldehyde:ferredoxin oxidoreductase